MARGVRAGGFTLVCRAWRTAATSAVPVPARPANVRTEMPQVKLAGEAAARLGALVFIGWSGASGTL